MSSGRAAHRRLAPSVWSRRAKLVVAALWAVGTCGLGTASAASTDSLIDEKTGALIDWRRGIVEATGGAAADPRMPSADAARPGAERRARAAARARLSELLKALPLGGGRRLDEADLARALTRARTIGVDYQSNGGALVRLAVAFGDWSEPPPPSASQPPGGSRQHGDAAAESSTGSRSGDSASTGPSTARAEAATALTISEAHLVAAPLVVVGGQEVMPASVRYLTAAELPAGLKPLVARADKKGRLIIASDGKKSSSTGVAPGTAEDAAAKFAGKPLVVYVHKILR